jgi:hypothetical protein
MPKPRQLTALLATAAALAGLASLPAVPALARAPRARTATTTCNIRGKEESLGPTYVTRVSVSGGASCSFALRLVRSYYQCRLKHGGVKGSCSGVDGFRCSERRLAKITVQFDAEVSCSRGSERVRHNFTQFT